MKIVGKTTSRTPKQPWHSVSIVPGAKPCDAVLANPRRRLLSGNAPRLPLKDCSDPDQCQCKFQHHPDRRAGARRTDDSGGGGQAKTPGSNRRRPGERRA